MRFAALDWNSARARDCCPPSRGKEVTAYLLAGIKASHAACDAQALHRYRRRAAPRRADALEPELLVRQRHRCRARGSPPQLGSEGARASTSKPRGNARGRCEFIGAIALIPSNTRSAPMRLEEGTRVDHHPILWICRWTCRRFALCANDARVWPYGDMTSAKCTSADLSFSRSTICSSVSCKVFRICSSTSYSYI